MRHNALFLLSLGGFPPMAGFIAKWYVFSAAVKAGYTGLAIIGVLTSVMSVFFATALARATSAAMRVIRRSSSSVTIGLLANPHTPL